MNINNKFIVVDGPNGVGKSTVLSLLDKYLRNQRVEFVFTKEPTNSTLGTFIRSNQDSYFGRVLATLVAADRYDHISRIIEPSINSGKAVISDRYLASSLVYQIQDGVSHDLILNLNSEIILPGTYFILTASPEALANRLHARNKLTRFEVAAISIDEGYLFEQAGVLLRELGVKVIFMENEYNSAEVTAKQMAAQIIKDLGI